jgi:molybdopterin-guanine dinucleotide biosynthesis protein A
MEAKKHQKHANINRPAYGQFHLQEWNIIGTPCGKIQALAQTLIKALSAKYRIAYVDADHASGDQAVSIPSGAHQEYTDKINFHRFDTHSTLSPYQFRMHFRDQDVVLANGNHFHAKNQIVVIDPKKEDSLKRKLNRLDNISLVLYSAEGPDTYEWLEQAMPHFRDIPRLPFDAADQIAAFLDRALQNARPPLYGLVLAGGKSQRMGEDKSMISYYGMPQWQYSMSLLSPFCEEVYVSCRPGQEAGLQNPLPDTFTGLGPYGGLLSAFRAFPEAAWLVLACDIPLMDKATLEYLVSHRNSSKAATAFNSPRNEFPEPLVSIWEPRSYINLLQFLAQGYSCPRKVLINTEVALLDLPKPDVVRNANTPEERAAILDYIKKQAH